MKKKVNQKMNKVNSPILVKKSLVKEQLKMPSKNIITAEPFLDFPLNDIQHKIARMVLNSAFQNMLPINNEITQFITPTTIATI